MNPKAASSSGKPVFRCLPLSPLRRVSPIRLSDNHRGKRSPRLGDVARGVKAGLLKFFDRDIDRPDEIPGKAARAAPVRVVLGPRFPSVRLFISRDYPVCVRDYSYWVLYYWRIF